MTKQKLKEFFSYPIIIFKGRYMIVFIKIRILGYRGGKTLSKGSRVIRCLSMKPERSRGSYSPAVFPEVFFSTWRLSFESLPE